jgi:hypothetical protein
VTQLVRVAAEGLKVAAFSVSCASLVRVANNGLTQHPDCALGAWLVRVADKGVRPSERLRKQKRQREAGGTGQRRNDIQHVLYARSNYLSRTKMGKMELLRAGLHGGAMRGDGPPLAVLLDEGVCKDYRGSERLAFEVSDLRGAADHDGRIAVDVHLHV